MTTLKFRTIDAPIAHHAGQRPERAALICDGRTLTYGELHRASNRLAHALRAAGCARGARVGYLGMESERYYELLIACARAEVVLVPINWRLTPPEIAYILRDAGCEVLFVQRDLRAAVAERAAELPQLRLTVELDGDGAPGGGLTAWAAAHPDADVAPTTGPEDPIVQLYTSGTTGMPKGVVLAHRSFFQIRDHLAASGLDWIDWKDDDVSLIGIPGFHVAGVWWAMQAFTAGVPNVVMRVFRGADAVRLIRDCRVTTTLIVPAMIHMLVSEPHDATTFTSLRKVAYGGSPISESLLRTSMDVLGCELVQMYGLTESGNVAVCLPPKEHVIGSPRMRAAGVPLPGVSVKVIDGGGNPVPVGQVGQICLRTPAVMLGYWGLEAATRETLVDGWLHTGDAGYVDADGYVFISDRIKDTIIVAGENIYPAEVENALCKHPAVADVAVIGVPDERWGEAVRAFVVLRAGMSATPRELMMSLRGVIADFKIPTQYEIVESVPRNPSGKILRRVLRDRAWAHMARKVN